MIESLSASTEEVLSKKRGRKTVNLNYFDVREEDAVRSFLLAKTSEEKNKIIARRSIHINDNLQLGHVLTEGDLIMKRPGDGISPINIENILKILLT